jgi:myb proto-oncogene protein
MVIVMMQMMTDRMTDTQPNDGATTVNRRWTLEEDAKLTSAVANTRKKKWGSDYKTDWATVAALVPGRTARQCKQKWKDGLDPSIDRTTGRKGRWTEDEDIKLKDAVQTHGGKDWSVIAAMVPARTIIQCRGRWHKAVDPSDWTRG